jgi:hypothetical protein
MGLYINKGNIYPASPGGNSLDRLLMIQKLITLPSGKYEVFDVMIDEERRILVESVDMTFDVDRINNLRLFVHSKDTPSSEFSSMMGRDIDLISPQSSGESYFKKLSTHDGEKITGIINFRIPFTLEADQKLVGLVSGASGKLFIRGKFLD